MDWRPIPHAEGHEMSEAGDVRRADGLLVPYYRLLWGGASRGHVGGNALSYDL